MPALVRSVQFGEFMGRARSEAVLLVVIVALVALILLVRFFHSSDHRRRKAANSALSNRRGTDQVPVDRGFPAGRNFGGAPLPSSKRGRGEPMAPSFTSASSNRSQRPPSAGTPTTSATIAPADTAPFPAHRPKGGVPSNLPAMPAPAPPPVRPTA
ncbi:MAG: hypothetical protein ABSB09_06325 [Acidimicrobiales bacterium]|jgi:hypothetical protein